MYSRHPHPRLGGAGFGLGGPVPRDVIVLLAVVFVTFSLQFFASTAAIPALLRLTPLVWARGFVWQLATYPYSGTGGPSFWFVLELLILFLFTRDVFLRLGRRGFWRFLLWVTVAAAAIAVAVQAAMALLGSGPAAVPPFTLMQGQHVLVTVMIAAFATLNRDATIYLFFVLPVEARWFIPLEIVFAFLGFLGTRDLAGFVGLAAAVGIAYAYLSPVSARRLPRQLWLRAQRAWLEARMGRLRRKRGFRLVKRKEPEAPEDRWLH